MTRYEIPGMIFAVSLVIGAIAVIGKGVWLTATWLWLLLH